MPKPGDQCPAKCGGQLRVKTSRRAGDVQMRYLECNCCGCNGGKSLVPVREIFSKRTDAYMKN